MCVCVTRAFVRVLVQLCDDSARPASPLNPSVQGLAVKHSGVCVCVCSRRMLAVPALPAWCDMSLGTLVVHHRGRGGASTCDVTSDQSLFIQGVAGGKNKRNLAWWSLAQDKKHSL